MGKQEGGGDCEIDCGSIALGSRRWEKKKKEAGVELNSNELPRVKQGPGFGCLVKKNGPPGDQKKLISFSAKCALAHGLIAP